LKQPQTATTENSHWQLRPTTFTNSHTHEQSHPKIATTIHIEEQVQHGYITVMIVWAEQSKAKHTFFPFPYGYALGIMGSALHGPLIASCTNATPGI